MNNSILPSNMTHTHTHIPKIDIYIALPNHHSLRSACTYNERTHTFVFNVPYSFARGSDFVVDNHFRCQFFFPISVASYGTLSWHIMRIEEKFMVREKNQFCSRFFIHHLVSLVRVHRGMAIFSAAKVIFWFVVGVWWSLRCSYMEMHLKWTHINGTAEKDTEMTSTGWASTANAPHSTHDSSV